MDRLSRVYLLIIAFCLGALVGLNLPKEEPHPIPPGPTPVQAGNPSGVVIHAGDSTSVIPR
jgi:hypothetical protein